MTRGADTLAGCLVLKRRAVAKLTTQALTGELNKSLPTASMGFTLAEYAEVAFLPEGRLMRLRQSVFTRLLPAVVLIAALALPVAAQGLRGGRNRRGGIDARLKAAGLELGGQMPDVSAHDDQGNPIQLRSLLADRYTVIVSGCLTCPVFLRTFRGVEAVHRDYAAKRVKFYYLYKALAHPENNGFVRPFTLDERLMHVAEAKKRTGAKIPWIADTMENDVKHALGNAPNSEFVFDSEGTIVYMKGWSDATALRAKLEELVGPVENPTQIADLDINHDVVTRSSTRDNVIPPLEVPRGLMAVKIKPVRGPNKLDETFYVKLRAEVTRDLLRSGEGKMYLGFHLDPVHSVYWNNLVDPVRYELTLPEGLQVTPAQGEGPKVEQDKDRDPREFLVDVKGASVDQPLQLKVDYYGCTDTWCKPISQSYEIFFERDPDGGTAMSARGRGAGPERFLSRLMEMDQDGDGKLSKDEVPERMLRRFDFMDANSDGYVDEEEIAGMRERMRQRMQGPGRPQRPVPPTRL